ncbi:TRML4 protein, partial [Emberiza fucata]|nr:TRML4 protein [Emberiza fucata]
LQGQAPEAQRRREGDTLYVQCSYAAWSAGQQTKYWCLPQGTGRCQEVLRMYSYEDSKQSQDGRIQIKDNKDGKTVSVTMTGLKAEDSGTYFCAIYYSSTYVRLRTISLIVFRGEYLFLQRCKHLQGGVKRAKSVPQAQGRAHPIMGNPTALPDLLRQSFSWISPHLNPLILPHSKGNREAEDTSDSAEGTAQPGSTGRRGSSQDGSKGPAYINLDVQPHPSPEDPLYCNVEPSQAPRNPQHVEYAIIAFNQPPRTSKE